MKTKLHLGVLLLLSLFLVNCLNSDKKILPKSFDYGEVKDNVYSNSFFNFSMIIPSDWVVQDQEISDELMELGKNMIAGEDEKMKARLNAATIKTANLLTVFQYELGTPDVVFNPSIALVAENLKLTPGIKTGANYLTQARKLLLQTQIYDYVDEEFEKETFGGVDFYVMNAVIGFEDFEVLQQYYVAIQDGFALVFIVSFADEEQGDILMKSMNSIKFGAR